MMRLVWVLASLLLLSPGIVSAQTVRSRTLDADGNAITSGTSAPAGTERGIHTRQVGPADVNCLTGCATPADTTGATVTFNDANDIATVALAGLRGAVADIAAGTCDAELVAEVSTNGGTFWHSAVFGNKITGIPSSSVVLGNPNSAQSYDILYPGSITNARVLPTSFTSGSCDVTLRATTTNTVVMMYGAEVSGGGMQVVPFKASTPAGTEMAPLFRCIGCTSTGGTNAADNTVWVYGTTAVTPAGFVYDTTPTAPTDGRVGAARMNVNRDTHAALVDPDGVEVAEASTNAVRVTGVTVFSVQGYNRRNSGTLGSDEATVALDVTGVGSIRFEVAGTCTCTIVAEGTTDDSTWHRIPMVLSSTSSTSIVNEGKTIRTITNLAAQTYIGWLKTTGWKQARLRVDTYSSGSPTGALEGSMAPSGIHPTAVQCTETTAFNTATGTTPLQLVAGVSGEMVYICGIDISSDGTTTAKIVEGTDANCASTADLSGTHRLTAQTGWVRDATFGSVAYRSSTTGRFVCVQTGSSVQIDGTVNWARY